MNEIYSHVFRRATWILLKGAGEDKQQAKFFVVRKMHLFRRHVEQLSDVFQPQAHYRQGSENKATAALQF